MTKQNDKLKANGINLENPFNEQRFYADGTPVSEVRDTAVEVLEREHQIRAAKAILPKAVLTVELASVNNVDFDERGKNIRSRTVKVGGFKEARAVCLEFIRDNDLGGGNWTGGTVRDNHGRVIGYVSYNGRCWEWDGESFTATKREIVLS